MAVAEYFTHQTDRSKVAHASEEWLRCDAAPEKLVELIDMASDDTTSSHDIEDSIDQVIVSVGQPVLEYADYFWVLALGLALNLVRLDEYHLAEFFAIGFTRLKVGGDLFGGYLADTLYIDDGLPRERIIRRIRREFDLDRTEIIEVASEWFSRAQGKGWVLEVIVRGVL
ncbi:hypothetical protein [Propionibacterium cyclohexanicum]|uniref:hypothetical protein n=1 Tax=Propionibacterium cyclohexanicum TaxID=64702 RepID=UPI00115FA092|nr:hypothetical protein [Propionibacterium cyclohexanicum]